MKTEPINTQRTTSQRLKNAAAAVTAGTILLIPSHAKSADYFEKTMGNDSVIIQQAENTSDNDLSKNKSPKQIGGYLSLAALLSAMAGIGITTKYLFNDIKFLRKDNLRLKNDNIIKDLEIKRLEEENKILNSRIKRLQKGKYITKDELEEKKKRTLAYDFTDMK